MSGIAQGKEKPAQKRIFSLILVFIYVNGFKYPLAKVHILVPLFRLKL